MKARDAVRVTNKIPRFKDDEYGQMGIMDALLFLIILTVASTVLIVGIVNTTSDHEEKSEDFLIQYTNEALGSIITTTFYRVEYKDWRFKDESGPVTGQNVELYNVTMDNRSVADLMIFDIKARHRIDEAYKVMGSSIDAGAKSKMDICILTINTGLEQHINSQIERMIDNNYHYVMTFTYGNIRVELREEGLPQDYYPEEITTADADLGAHTYLVGAIDVQLIIWPDSF